MNPQAPVLYGLLKLHKDNVPIRPVVSYMKAPSYKVCKALNKTLPEFLEFNPKHRIKNSLDLINKVKHISIPHSSILVSFDVKSLFTSIPTQELRQVIHNNLISNKVDDTVIEELSKLLDLCLNQNYFQFQDKFYQLKDGLPMGSPLSPLLAEIFMDHFERKLFNTNSNIVSHINFWYRYVDDVLCLFTGTMRQLDKLLNLINSINPSISFTMEKESDSCLNFLDINIKRLGNYFDFSIFRKPTYTDTIIPFNSHHPTNIKLSTFHSLFHRLISIPMSSDNYNKELTIIKTIAVNNGYSWPYIKNLLNKKLNKRVMKEVYTISNTEEEKTFRKLNFVGHLSNLLQKKLKKIDITSGLYNLNTIKQSLVNNKLVIKDRLLASGVYEIKCNDCQYIYIGQTGRSFKVRFQEHLRSWKLKKHNSFVAKHMLDYGHGFTLDNFKILHITDKSYKLNLLEQFEIHNAKINGKPLMNDLVNNLNSQILINLSELYC